MYTKSDRAGIQGKQSVGDALSQGHKRTLAPPLTDNRLLPFHPIQRQQMTPAPAETPPSGLQGVVQRVIAKQEKTKIQKMTRSEVLGRMKHPLEGEEPGEIATEWLKTNKSSEELEHFEWIALLKESGVLDDTSVDESESEEWDEEEEPEVIPQSMEVWKKEARTLIDENESLEHIAVKKVAQILMLHQHGIFNAIGRGGNSRYIRSTENTAIKLTGGSLSQEDNKAGRIPDMFQGITPKEWRAVIKVLSKSHDSQTLLSGSISEYIVQQRSISKKIMEGTKLPASKEDEPPLMTFVFDGNYPALNIHFPALVQHIKTNQEIKSKKGTVGAAQSKGMTKFFMGRLIHLYNAHMGQSHLKLVEKSSFGFQTPTLGDLGDNLSIRLSPGVDTDVIGPMCAALDQLGQELQNLMGDKTKVTPGKVKDSDDLYKYWDPGLGGRGPKAHTLRDSYNKEKTTLDHLLFTQVEKGAKGNTIIGRTLDRNHDNIIHLSSHDKTLTQWAQEILKIHSPEELTKHLQKGGLNAPQLLSNKELKAIASETGRDEVSRMRLALFQEVAKKLENDEEEDVWDEEASDSEFEDEYEDEPEDEEDMEIVSENKKNIITTGKAVVPSGMASLDQILGSPVKTKKSQVGSKMEKGVYYEDFDHAKKNFRLAGYKADDIVIQDLNPNITTSEEKKEVGAVDAKSILEKLGKSTNQVWIIDMTSSTQEEQRELFARWKKNKDAELLITLVSGVKQQEMGLNTNPHGLIHWAYKGKGEKFEAIKKHFTDIRADKINTRSKVSNQIRRIFKKEKGSHSWSRLLKDEK